MLPNPLFVERPPGSDLLDILPMLGYNFPVRRDVRSWFSPLSPSSFASASPLSCEAARSFAFFEKDQLIVFGNPETL
jgi:hypothetical protein